MTPTTMSVERSVDFHRRISRIYDHLYGAAEKSTPAGISAEVGKILHVGMYVEETKGAGPAFDVDRSEAKRLLGGDRRLVNETASLIREQFAAMNRAWEVYSDDRIGLGDFDIAYCVAQLSGILISDRERDIFGDALEVFRSTWAKQVGGQFFTDQRVTSLAIKLLRFDPRNGDDLIDLCAGTGGFLLAGLAHIEELLSQDSGTEAHEAELVSLATASLRGCEIDPDVQEAANATLAARLGLRGEPLVHRADALRLDPLGLTAPFSADSHACAATNPPFGSKITVKDPEVLSCFDLARLHNGAVEEGRGNNGDKLYPRPPDILFLEQNVRMLKPGTGRLAIVLPYQILSGPRTYYVRHWLLRQVHLEAVVELPPETFQPHTGTKAALVVMRRREQPLDDPRKRKNTSVFMSSPRWIGHDRRGNPVFERTADGRLTDRVLTDLPEVGGAFNRFAEGEDPTEVHEFSFILDMEAVCADRLLRINPLYHRPLKAVELNSESLSDDKWKTVTIGDVTERVFFPGRFKRNYVDYEEGAVPFLGGTNISQLLVSTEKFLAPSDPKIPEIEVEAGWILVTRSGSTGMIATVPEAWEGFAISEHVIRIVPKPEKLPGEYLQAFLRSRLGQTKLSRGVYGSVIDEITPDFIASIEVPVPRDPAVLDEIVQLIQEGEEARQEAIDRLTGGVSVLESYLSSS